VRLLGEDLVLYKDASGGYGLLDRHCPHRRADLSYGMVEACGLRCHYHGWHFDGTGRCLEQPFEDAAHPDGRFRDKIRITAYPVEAKAGLQKPLMVHAILETARGMVNVEEICAASPRMQGLSLGPADLAADRRMKTTRVGGGHPGYLVRQDPRSGELDDINATGRKTYQQDLWHYTISRMVDACVSNGIYPYYGPFGDIADMVACEDQFRNAYLLGCVGTWSLHPRQIAIANKVFSPSVEDVAHARRVVAAMGDGTGAVMLEGKMEDDASLKQCLVMVRLAEQLAAVDPELKRKYDAIEVAT